MPGRGMSVPRESRDWSDTSASKILPMIYVKGWWSGCVCSLVFYTLFVVALFDERYSNGYSSLLRLVLIDKKCKKHFPKIHMHMQIYIYVYCSVFPPDIASNGLFGYGGRWCHCWPVSAPRRSGSKRIGRGSPNGFPTSASDQRKIPSRL